MPRPRDRQKERVMAAEDEVTDQCHWLLTDAIDGTGTMSGVVPTVTNSRWWFDQLDQLDLELHGQMNIARANQLEHMEVIWLTRQCKPFMSITGGEVTHHTGQTVRASTVFRRIRLDARYTDDFQPPPAIAAAEHRFLSPVTHTYHALAHHLHGPDTEMHGPEFAGAYLMLMTEFSNDLAGALRHQYGEYSVDFRPPVSRWTSEAARERALRETLAIRDELAADIEKGEW